MSTLYSQGYNRSYYTETSGNWTAPSTCNAALIVASGGGGGGGASGAVGTTGVGGSSGQAGSPGGNGGTTTFVGPNLSLSFAGGNGGSGSPGSPGGATPAPIARSANSVTAGLGGYHSGGLGRAAPGATYDRTGTHIKYSPDSVEKPNSIINLEFGTYLRGGNGALTGHDNTVGAAPNYATAGAGVNGGVGGQNFGASPVGVTLSNAPNAVFNSGGGDGGYAIGQKYPAKIQPGQTYTITIGSGGAGGSAAGSAAFPNVGGCNNGLAGGGGASGFVYILWNDKPEGT